MKFLKITNRPLDFVIPKKDGKPDWALVGINPEIMMSHLVQEHVSMEVESDYISLLPINDETNVHLLKLIDETNNNENPNDMAEIIDLTKYDKEKKDLLAIKAEKKLKAKESL